MDNITVVLVALYRYRNFPLRIMHPLLQGIDGVKVFTVFFKDCESNAFRPYTKREEELFAEVITQLDPRLVGFSVLTPFVPVARRLTRLVRNTSSAMVIWGGIHPTISPETCISDVDLLCVGEGEEPLKELVTCFRDNKPYQSIDNLWVKDGDRFIQNPMRPLIRDLDSLPFPSHGNNSFYFIDSNRVTTRDPCVWDNYFWVQTSRGCPYTCSYCVNSVLRPLFKGLGPYTRRRSVGNVIAEIKEARSVPGNRINYIFFVDEVFATQPSWLEEFGHRYKAEVGLPFYVEYNPRLLNSGLVSKLATAGLDRVDFGIQAGTDYIRNEIFNRPGKGEELVAVAKALTKHGVNIKYDLILDNPYDTDESLLDGIKLLLRLPRPLMFGLYSLQYFPGYPITVKALEDRHIRPEDATLERIAEITKKAWVFDPRLFPYTRRQVLQNIIWLFVRNHAGDGFVRYSVFGSSLPSKLCLNYLNLKAVLLGKAVGLKRVLRRHSTARAIRSVLRGDLKTAYLALRNRADRRV